ncbi:hypothetical protein [Agarivorans gilvus]|uniref:Uncharacterized protein n=1 Tax=Agarivorans gilvus TaxID=680279 RepID=A0ABQ1I894_9ALTE|nr:hypothetical protein [Agarivorans gilvus]GGB22075.1 hypothetical protein GCM10007414_39330 [Agarivorans gilvus]
MSQQQFDGEKPQAMVEFLNRFELEGELPVSFLSEEGVFLLSIQYLIEDCWNNSFDHERKLLRFGVNTDGWDLLINIDDDQLDILQDEMGDIDSIDITIFDLLDANLEKVECCYKQEKM